MTTDKEIKLMHFQRHTYNFPSNYILQTLLFTHKNKEIMHTNQLKVHRYKSSSTRNQTDDGDNINRLKWKTNVNDGNNDPRKMWRDAAQKCS
jgi:hypothetical protein